MIEERARVVRTQKDVAWVETERKTACGSCLVNKGCGAGALARVLGQRRTRLRVLDPIGVDVGDEVVVGVREDALVRGAVAVYAAPLLAMLGGAVLGEYATRQLAAANSEVWVMGAGLVGFAFGLLWLRRFARLISADARYQAVILRKVGQVPAAAVAGATR